MDSVCVINVCRNKITFVFLTMLPNSPPLTPVTISTLPQLTCNVHIVHICISFGKILMFFQQISQFQLRIIANRICILNVYRNKIIFVFFWKYFTYAQVHSCNDVTSRQPILHSTPQLFILYLSGATVGSVLCRECEL